MRLEADFFYSQPIPLTPGTENILWNNITLNLWIFLQFGKGGSSHKTFIFFEKTLGDNFHEIKWQNIKIAALNFMLLG